MRQSIELRELAADGERVHLSETTAAELARTGLLSVEPVGRGTWKLLPVGRVGAVEVGDVSVVVRPKDKVGIRQLLFLLGYASDPGFRPGDVDGIPDSDVWAALGETLARQGERALSRGALQGYVRLEDSLRTVRGRIRMSDQLTRRPGFLLPLEVAFDEYTVDIPENQILRAAVRRMLHVPRLSADVRRRLRHIDSKLDGVSVLISGTELPKWQSSRSNTSYAAALRLSALILQNMSAETGAGGVRVASFVVNMAKVFEDFTTVALTEALRAFPGETTAQYQEFMDEQDGRRSRDRISMNVDIVHSIRAEPAVVFDAKYKAASASGQYPNADHYQMLAYCTALRVSTAWLVYAGPGEVRRRRVTNTNVEIVEYPLDLSRSPQEVLARVERLAALSVQNGPLPESVLDLHAQLVES